MIQVSAGSKYDPSQAPDCGKSDKASGSNKNQSR